MRRHDDTPLIFDPKKPTAPFGSVGFPAPTRKNVPVTNKDSKGAKPPAFNRNTISSTVDSAYVVNSEDSTDTAGIGLVHGADGLSFLERITADEEHIAKCLMIDTLDLELPDVAHVDDTEMTRSFGRLDANKELVDETDWSKGTLQTSTGKRSLRIGFVKKTKTLTIEGSYAMHKQGHNVVSSGDVQMLAYHMIRAAKHELKIALSQRVGFMIAHGHLAHVTRIDVVLLLKIPDGVSKAAFLNAMAISGIHGGLSTSLYINESVYFDQNSQLEATKLYDKAAQLERARKGSLPEIEGIELLHSLNERTVRLELVFRKKKLKQIASKLGHEHTHPFIFTKEVLAGMVKDLLFKHSCHGQIFRRLEYRELLAIPLPYRSDVAHWQNGMTMSEFFETPRKQKEHAAYIRKHHSIDISAPPPDSITESMSLFDIFSPQNFLPVPHDISSNSKLFYEVDMQKVIQSFPGRVGPGMGGILINPNEVPDEIIEIDGVRTLI